MRMRVFSMLLFLIFGVMGCALLQEIPLVEIPASRLTCNQNPAMVDGNLKQLAPLLHEGPSKKNLSQEKEKRYTSLGSISDA